ncbi:MAG: FtsX-like permease family protein, partial [Alistipes sp.]|nr:FtsX-like permease family protein [Alistipes sp.]
LATHDTNALVIIVIMLVVALLNITTALLINVLERQRMIGELRALGMPRSSIVGIFLFRVLFVIGRGMAWGIALGITIAVVQHLWAVVPLPSAGYILATVPATLCWVEWGIAIAATIIVAMVVMLLPALLAARVSPAKAIRYE